MIDIKHFELPIELTDIACVTDCWIFNRLIIIKNSIHYNDWIASHYNLFANSIYNFHFGELNITDPNYHDDILERKPFNIFKTDEKNVISELSQKVLDGYYINLFIKLRKDIDKYHEVVIYGFDNATNSFLVVGLKNQGFEKMDLPYDFLIETWSQIKEYFITKCFRGIELSMNYQHPASLFKLKESYNIENCTVEAYKKLRKELYGSKISISSSQEFLDYKNSSIQYTGIECLCAAYFMISEELKKDNLEICIRRIISAIKKLYEHRKMILLSMNYIYGKWMKCMNNETIKYLEAYRENCKIFEKWLNLSLHYELTKTRKDLEIILNELPNVYKKEKIILDNFINHTINWDSYNKLFV